MSNAAPARAGRARTGRTIGEYRTGRPGPTLVAIAGLHGNEPSGVQAASAVLQQLRSSALPLHGRFLAVAGNLPALEAEKRFMVRDLNRMWTAEGVDQLDIADAAFDDIEQAEQRELLAIFRMLATEADDDVVYLDLHSTSAPGAAFNCISDTLHSRAIALASPIPLVLGVEEAIRGSLLEYMEEQGRPLILVEGGQHDDPGTVLIHEAAIWQTLVTVGCLNQDEVPDFAIQRERLQRVTGGLPQVVEILFRHEVGPDDGFVMRPHFVNFQPVKKSHVVADDRQGPIEAPVSGWLLLPLYQPQGDDGFFIARPIRKTWLSVSTLMRLLQVDHLLPRLPGVSPDGPRPHRLLVDTRVARWFTVQLFHLCGYRKLPPRDGKLMFTRRVEG